MTIRSYCPTCNKPSSKSIGKGKKNKFCCKEHFYKYQRGRVKGAHINKWALGQKIEKESYNYIVINGQ